MSVDVILGLQWGDEGKGKIVDFLTPKYKLVARFQGGPNAGHSIEFNQSKFVLNTIPSGIFHSNCLNLIGNGVVVDPIQLRKEIENLLPTDAQITDRLLISRKAHLILPTHRLLDAALEEAKGKAKIGSTLRGISPTYQDKIGRVGLRFGDIYDAGFETRFRNRMADHMNIIRQLGSNLTLQQEPEQWLEAIAFLRSKLKPVDSEYLVNDFLSKGEPVLAEGAQGTLLDIDFGTYPFVTSSNTVTAGACTGLGIAPQQIGDVYGIFKAYCTRVGSGPFPTELEDATGEELRQKGKEFGATTGRPRRTGWLDLVALKYAVMVNGANKLVMTKADVLSGFEQIKVATAYAETGTVFPYDLNCMTVTPEYTNRACWKEDLSVIRDLASLPATFHDYVKFIEQYLGMQIHIISTGPDREQTIIH